MTPMNNPLLDTDGLPAYDQVRPDHVAPALDLLLGQANAALESVSAEAYPADWMALSRGLDCANERLGRAWGVVSHLNAVSDTPELRAAFNAGLPRVTEFWTRLGAHAPLYAKYRAIDPAGMNAEQKQAHKHAVRDFVLSGANLEGPDKMRFAAIQERLAELSQKFSENALDATDAFAHYAGLDELAGVPDDVLATARAAAEQEGPMPSRGADKDFKLTLKMPCYLPVMQYAQHRGLRQTLYRANATRASDQDKTDPDGKRDNTPLIREILALRQEEARLLGFRNYGELSLAPKMAQSPEQVIAFLRDLAARARPHALQDLQDMREFARAQLGIDEPQSWDWLFIAERLKEARYAFNEQEVKQYFPAPKVLAGLFKIVETLFEVSIRRDEAPLWHPSVEFYRIERGGHLVGQFYLDPPARKGKRGGAWMDDARSRWRRPDTGVLQTPVAHLVTNFSEGQEIDGVAHPALLTHDDVITLFHEFGHGLHHMLTQVEERAVSGISGVEWDAVELPSQFMENFCWERGVVRHMSGHVRNGEPLPEALFDKMLAAKNFQSGLQTLRQVEFALFDMLLHTTHPPEQDFTDLLNQVRREVAVLMPPTWARSAHTFSHIFAGGYAAGYYSYKWAEVLSADVYAMFEEAAQSRKASTDGLPDAQTGGKYRRAILEVGGSRPAIESFKALRGREPTIDALLRHQGMA
jgi:oligopeptidase A